MIQFWQSINEGQRTDSSVSVLEWLGYEIDPFMFDRFWQHVSNSSCLPLPTAVFEWLGYDHRQERNNKAMFIQLLKSHDIQFRQIKHTDPDFTDYPELVEEADYLPTWTHNNLDKKR